ncbi:PREDICTED: butyrophilin subfamily 1 member A1-like [Chinchilla lanigera]|uniref:butyrophilin subfamily 1 member A1-like n=1 Tax=Chinchilla lanigera TaxID=34839 RepID=UPI000695CC9C|nr:PREDICTED: butyrophilin subfamily 1 member A1-like [Chinchilla lanigera]
MHRLQSCCSAVGSSSPQAWVVFMSLLVSGLSPGSAGSGRNISRATPAGQSRQILEETRAGTAQDSEDKWHTPSLKIHNALRPPGWGHTCPFRPDPAPDPLPRPRKHRERQAAGTREAEQRCARALGLAVALRSSTDRPQRSSDPAGRPETRVNHPDVEQPLGERQFQVKGPRSPVTAQVREEAVLPCHLSPPTDAQNMEIRWYRDHQSALVHEYRDSQDHTEQQSLQYQGRTELLRENITQGQVALRIHPVLPADEGQYSCVFVRSTQLSQAQFELRVAASGAPPHIHIQPAYTGSIKMTCSSSGWYPDPELQWRDPRGRPLSPGSVRNSVQDDGLIHVESSVTVEESSRADVSCSIRNAVLREEKESRLSVAKALFPRVSAWTVALAVLLAFSLIIAGFLLLRSRRAHEGILERITKEHERIAEERDKITREDEKIAKEHERIAKQRSEITAGVREQEKRFVKQCLKIAQRFAEDIVLDKDTAHPKLFVSEGGKRVECLSKEQAVPESPGRFTSLRAVLGRNSFSSGSHYWEVDVGESKFWIMGLCSDSVNREIFIKDMNSENGFRTIGRIMDYYWAYSLPHYKFKVVAPPLVVGIFLEYEQGLISFYDVKQFAILHIFKDKFTGPLRPYFFTEYVLERNYQGLVIPPVSPPDESGPP